MCNMQRNDMCREYKIVRFQKSWSAAAAAAALYSQCRSFALFSVPISLCTTMNETDRGSERKSEKEKKKKVVCDAVSSTSIK